MATIFPEQYPKLCIETLRGEAKVFDALKKQLGNEWNVYYSVYWHLVPSVNSRQRDGETDFIVTHPRYGILIIEVKGGSSIKYDALHNAWVSTDLGKNDNQIHDPYHQARKNKYAFLDSLHSLPQYQAFRKEDLKERLNVGYCVIFPDVTRISGSMPIDAPKEITLFENDLANLSNHLIDVLHHYSMNSYTDEKLIKDVHLEVKTLLAPILTMDRNMTYWINEEEKRIIELTEEQYNLLENLQFVKLASIYGCAGSGKTLLAQKKAEITAQQNQRTLLCCFNLILGKKFRKLSQENDNLLADNFHNVMKELLMPLGSGNIDFNSDEAIMIEILEHLEEIPLFDCILIDEAQDFSKDQLEILRYLLKEDGILYYFWDSNQKVIRSDVNVPDNIFKFQLNTNLRNTVKIFDRIQQHYHEDLQLRHRGPEGRDVKICAPYKSDSPHDLFMKLKAELNHLIIKQKLSPSDITILTFKAMTKSVLNDFSYNDVNIDCFKDEASPNSIRIDTVRRFKGMESPVVIVTEMDNEKSMVDPTLWDDMCYVSYSRAKNHLVILPPDNVTLK